MIDVISVKFKNRGKCYFFSPNGLTVKAGDKVIVDTAKGLEMADCCYGNHSVEDTAVVQPLRNVVRIATQDDLRVAEINAKREKEAFEICREKIAEHGLDMKLVDVECNFEGNKTLFFFTSEGRVDFRELVKDLASIFRNRIELRQIGVRDEAKMLGGIGICGRPYCCNQFLDDFQPVSTKMAKTQSLSLNPTKISGSCGRLMCCLRYEEDAYEDLVKTVPKQGAFVQTKDGYGTAVQVNLLRQTVKVRLDGDSDDSLHLYKHNELVAVPGGRPRDGETPPDVFVYVEEDTVPEEEPVNEWLDSFEGVSSPVAAEVPDTEAPAEKKSGGKRKRYRGKKKPASSSDNAQSPVPAPKTASGGSEKKGSSNGNEKKPISGGNGKKTSSGGSGKKSDSGDNGKKSASGENGKKAASGANEKKPVKAVSTSGQNAQNTESGGEKKKSNHKRRYYGAKKKSSGENKG